MFVTTEAPKYHSVVRTDLPGSSLQSMHPPPQIIELEIFSGLLGNQWDDYPSFHL